MKTAIRLTYIMQILCALAMLVAGWLEYLSVSSGDGAWAVFEAFLGGVNLALFLYQPLIRRRARAAASTAEEQLNHLTPQQGGQSHGLSGQVSQNLHGGAPQANSGGSPTFVPASTSPPTPGGIVRVTPAQLFSGIQPGALAHQGAAGLANAYPSLASQLRQQQQAIALAGAGGDVAPPAAIPRDGIRIGEITGYRCWWLRDGLLWSMSIGEIWAPGEAMTGKPGKDGCIGIHAFKLRRHSLKYPRGLPCSKKDVPAVFGAVAMWGEVYEHELGYRSEYAAITELDRPPWMERGAFADLRERYGLAG